MNQSTYSNAAIYAGESARAAFIRRTYLHLAGAILAFVVVTGIILQTPIAPAMVGLMTGGYGWLVVLGLFMGVSFLADKWARSETSPQMQYLGLGLFVVAEAIVFLPLLFIATHYASGNVIPTAAAITGFLFLGLTAVVFFTQKDFSWMRSILTIGGFIAMGFVVASIIFGFSLGLLFSVVMVAYAAGAILYDTSNVLHHYRTDQHVAAALALFASVALLFWYVLRIVMASSDD
ncbi:MAG TPA: Bax inhibitor-1 family protein [Blastocatellia bacterium]|nr:Bax inhibitor-1 family protein [Blastocatellia bacterium]